MRHHNFIALGMLPPVRHRLIIASGYRRKWRMISQKRNGIDGNGGAINKRMARRRGGTRAAPAQCM